MAKPLPIGVIPEIGKSASAGGNVERAITVMRHRPVARTAFDGDFARRERNDLLGNRTKRMDFARGDIQRADAASIQHAKNQFGNVVDQHVIAALLALAEQDNILAPIGAAAEAVGTVAVVGIRGAVEQARPNDCKRRGKRRECDLAGEMHSAMHARRRGRCGLGQQYRLVGIDGIRTDIDDMGDRHACQRIQHGPGHDHVFHHHGDVLARCAGRNSNHRICGTQVRSDLI